jgi:hypothetical protein
MSTTYYHDQLTNRLNNKTTLKVQFTDYDGNKTNCLDVNSESIDTLIHFLKGEKRRINEEIAATEKELTTEVIFKKEGTEVTAVMPYTIHDRLGNMTNYAHVGHHSACSPEYVKKLRNATEEEYTKLKSELEAAGYKIKVIKKIEYGKYIQALAKELRNE